MSGDLLARGNLHVPPLQQRIEFRLAFRTFAESLEQRWISLRVPNIFGDPFVIGPNRIPRRLQRPVGACWLADRERQGR